MMIDKIIDFIALAFFTFVLIFGVSATVTTLGVIQGLAEKADCKPTQIEEVTE
jgi:hypothetical protein